MRRDISTKVSAVDRARLERVVADRNSPQKHVWRAKIILATADGLGTAEIMRRSGKSKPSVWRWQERFMTDGVDGQTIIDRVIALTATEPPHQATHWTAAAMAAAVAISISSVQRIWRAHKLQPHRVRSFKLSTDPQFAARLRDIAGLYIDPPAHAVVLSVDEKSQIQALDRTQPGLPLKKDRCGTMTHDYKRHGTTTLFAALDVLEGKVIGRCMQRHRHQEFIRFLNTIEATVPVGKVVHVILDNYATHQAPEGQGVAGAPPALRLPLHADLLLMAQCRRGLLRQAHHAPSPTRRLLFDHRAPGRHQPLPRPSQRQPQTLRLDRRSG